MMIDGVDNLLVQYLRTTVQACDKNWFLYAPQPQAEHKNMDTIFWTFPSTYEEMNARNTLSSYGPVIGTPDRDKIKVKTSSCVALRSPVELASLETPHWR